MPPEDTDLASVVPNRTWFNQLLKGIKRNAHSAADVGVGTVELPMTIASGALAQPISGLAGLLNGADAETVDYVQNLLTYRPQSKSGKGAVEILARDIVSPIMEQVHHVPDYVYDKTGSPTLASATAAIPAALLAGSPFKFSPKTLLQIDRAVRSPTLTTNAVGRAVQNARGLSSEELFVKVLEDYRAGKPVGGESSTPRGNTSSPAWLKRHLAETVIVNRDPAKVRAAQATLDKIRETERLVGGGISPEHSDLFLRALNRPQASVAPSSVEQLPLDFKKGGSVRRKDIDTLWSLLGRSPSRQTRAIEFGQTVDKARRDFDLENLPPSVVRLTPEQRALAERLKGVETRARIVESQRNSPSMSAGAPLKRDFSGFEKAIIGAPIIGALSTSPASSVGRAGIAKLAKMLVEGSRSPAVIAGGAGIGAAMEGFEDNPTVAGALTNAAINAADVAAPVPSIAGQVLGYSPDAKAGLLTKALQKYGSRFARDEVENLAETLPGQLGVIKNKGGNWLTGSVEDSLRGLKKPGATPEQMLDLDSEYQALSNRNNALNSFIDKQLTRYVKNEMATPEDPIRALAERGVLHFEPQAGFDSRLIGKRENLGFPRMGMGELSTAQSWEGLADTFIEPETAGRFKVTRGQDGTTTMSRNPWLEKLPNDAVVHDLSANARPSHLGFDHLTDELANALNPESGLPRHLLLDPKSMDRVSVPQAVERVSQINAWRTAQKAEADMLRANNAATVLHKEYPDKGFKWVELKAPDAWPEGADREALGDLGRYSKSTLADALKYEGDTMGHCVGGYCDDVASGYTKIYSLRDAKGQPHVTIEVGKPKNELAEVTGDESAESDQLYRNLEQLLEEGGVENAAAHVEAEAMGYVDDIPSNVRDMIQELYPQAEAMLPKYKLPAIVQIKGKQNRAPNEEYLPFVQDFVKSGKWSDVGDLQNTGLTRHSSGKYISDAEATAMVQRHFGDVKMGNRPDDIENPWQYANRIRRYDPDMLSDTDKAFLTDWEAGNFAKGGSVNSPGNFAKGGRVRTHFTPSDLHAIISSLEAGRNA